MESEAVYLLILTNFDDDLAPKISFSNGDCA